MKKIIIFAVFFTLLTAKSAFSAENAIETDVISDVLETFLAPIASFLTFLFLGSQYQIFGDTYKLTILGFPTIVLWLIAGGIFFTLKLRFINIRLFAHAIDIVRGKYSNKDDPGEITHLQALFTAISATVGLGNIAGVAIAISIGGPGAVIWMMIAGFLGMSTKLAEVTLGQKYRKFDKDGHLMAGPFYYLEAGLSNKGYIKLGKFMGKLSAACCILGAIGAGIMFQANQTVAVISDNFDLSYTGKLIFALFLSVTVGFILIGGIKRIASIASAIVPFMAATYILSCIIILAINYTNIGTAVTVMFNSAFSANALHGGIIGAIIQGFRRAAFSNEAGMGTAPIAHAAAKTKEPVREGAVALLEPFIDTIVICFMTGIVITVTGVYQNAEISDGVLITGHAFATVSDWFPYVLSLTVFLFAFSTMLTYSYYGEQAWGYLIKGKLKLCQIIFVCFIFIGSMIHLGIVIDLADILFLSIAIPNLIGLYIMSGEIRQDVETYVKKLKSGKFKKN